MPSKTTRITSLKNRRNKRAIKTLRQDTSKKKENSRENPPPCTAGPRNGARSQNERYTTLHTETRKGFQSVCPHHRSAPRLLRSTLSLIPLLQQRGARQISKSQTPPKILKKKKESPQIPSRPHYHAGISPESDRRRARPHCGGFSSRGAAGATRGPAPPFAVNA